MRRNFGAACRALFLLGYFVRQPKNGELRRNQLLSLSAFELIPLPFVLFTMAISPLIGGWGILPLGAVAIILEIVIYEFRLSRLDLERRVFELSTIDQVSRALINKRLWFGQA